MRQSLQQYDLVLKWLKRAFHRAGDHSPALDNAKFVKFPKSPPNILKVFNKRSLHSPNVLHVFGMFKIPVTIWGTDILTQNPKRNNIFPKYSQKNIHRIHQMCVNCSPLFATFVICPSCRSQVVSKSQINCHASYAH